MIEQVAIIGLGIFGIYYIMLEGEILSIVGDWMYRYMPHNLQKPLHQCPICMVPWYGSIIYWLIPWHHHLRMWPFVILAAMGLNYILNSLISKTENVD